MNAAVEGVAGLVKTRLDAKSEMDAFPLEWFGKLQRLLAYPTAGDRYVHTVPTLSYHDAADEGFSPLSPSSIERYVAKVSRDASVGYLGPYLDDMNWQTGFRDWQQDKSAYEPEAREKADLLEAIRAAQPNAVVEINSQFWDLWPLMKAHDPQVERALRFVNVVTKEFNVSAESGINTAGRYAEWLEYTDRLAAKGIGTTFTGANSAADDTEADREYSLASYLLVNTGLDFIGFAHQSPLNEYPALRGMNLGEQAQPRTQLPSGLWTRTFTHGEAIVAPPGTSGSVALPRVMTRIGASSPVTSVTVSGGQGAVLIG
jgi:hypothetical protein